MQSAIALLLQFRYVILIPLAVIEGPIMSLVAGFLVSTGTFDFLPAYIIMILGDLLPDIACYFFGYFGGQRILKLKYFGHSERNVGSMEAIGRLWKNHTKKTLVLSKLAYGLSMPLLVTAGFFKVQFKKFFGYVSSVALLEHAFLMTLGFYLGFSYFQAFKYVEYIGIFIAVVFVLFIIGYVWFSKYFRSKFIQTEKLAETETQS